MFDRYESSVRRRIYSLLSSEIDDNVKLGIKESKKIVDNFIRDIRRKKLETWESLKEYVDSKYFYDECVAYVDENIEEYEERYRGISNKGKVSEKQVKYLLNLIDESLKHKNPDTKEKAVSEVKAILALLSKNSASYYIDRLEHILGRKYKPKETPSNQP